GIGRDVELGAGRVEAAQPRRRFEGAHCVQRRQTPVWGGLRQRLARGGSRTTASVRSAAMNSVRVHTLPQRSGGYAAGAGGSPMTTTVYFGTNRVVNQPPTAVANYTFNIISPTRPQDMTYGTAFVDSAGLTADTVGAIRSIQDLNKGGFTQEIID